MVIVGVIAETAPGESRVALTPAVVPALTSAGIEVVVAARAGTAAGFSDDAYREKGARVASREEALAAQVIARVQATDSADILPAGSVVIRMGRPPAGAAPAGGGGRGGGAALSPGREAPRTGGRRDGPA